MVSRKDITVRRVDIAKNIQRDLGAAVSHSSAAEAVDEFFDVIAEAIEDGHKIKISNLGIFEKRAKKERIGRNPKTMEEAVISARNVPRFTVSKKLLEDINS